MYTNMSSSKSTLIHNQTVHSGREENKANYKKKWEESKYFNIKKIIKFKTQNVTLHASINH